MRRGLLRGLARSTVISTVLGGGGASFTLSQDSTALLFFDDFNRADSGTVGSPTVDPGSEGAWVEEERAANMQIVSNKLDMHEGAGSGVKYLHRPDTEPGSSTPIYIEAILQWADASQPAMVNAHEAGNAFAARDGFQLRMDDQGGFLRIDRHDAGTGTLSIASVAYAPLINTDYYYQFFVDDSVQKGIIARLSNDAASAVVSATDATHDSINRRVGIQQGGTSAQSLWDAIWGATKSTIDVTGLSSGQKVQVQLVSDSSVVLGATESGGSVSLDVSRIFGTLTEPWPALEGVALKLVLLSSGDDVLDTIVGSDLSEGNIFPGSFSVS